MHTKPGTVAAAAGRASFTPHCFLYVRPYHAKPSGLSNLPAPELKEGANATTTTM